MGDKESIARYTSASRQAVLYSPAMPVSSNICVTASDAAKREVRSAQPTVLCPALFSLHYHSHQNCRLPLPVSVPIYLSLPPPTNHSGGGGKEDYLALECESVAAGRICIPRAAVSNAFLKATSMSLSPPTDYSEDEGVYLSTASLSLPTDHSGDDKASPSNLNHTPTDGTFATTHRRT